MLQTAAEKGPMPRTLNFTTTQQSLANTWLLAAVSTTPELIQLQKKARHECHSLISPFLALDTFSCFSGEDLWKRFVNP